MKKLIYLTLAAAFMGSVSSCKNEEADIFDDTAANRLEQFKKDYSKIFTDKGGKWALEYFANSTEPGYVFVVTFNEDNSVEIAGNNKWLSSSDMGGGSAFATDNSMWGIVSDDGPVLTFNTYNKVFHIFSSPDNIPGGPTYSDGEKQVDVNETGKGHEGDYEFVIMGLDETGEVVTLQGKKRGYKALLRRLPVDTDDREYLEKVYVNSHSNVCTEFGTLLLHEITTDRRFTITEVSESYMQGHIGLFEAYPQGGDSIQQTVSENAIVTYDGLRFRKDFEVPLPYSDDDVITINSFIFQPDGSLRGVSNPDVVLRAPMLADIVRNSSVEVGKAHVWDFTDCELGEKEALYNTVVDAIHTRYEGKRDFKGLGFAATNVDAVPTPSISLTFGSVKALLYLTITRVDDNTVRIESGDVKETNLLNLLKKVPEAEELLKSFEGTYTLESDDIMCPFTIRWVGDNGISFTAVLKR